MASLVIKNIPDSLHKRLKNAACSHRRSMVQEAIVILEEGLDIGSSDFPAPIKGNKELTQEILYAAIHEGRQ